jgi:hypothetical protein
MNEQTKMLTRTYRDGKCYLTGVAFCYWDREKATWIVDTSVPLGARFYYEPVENFCVEDQKEAPQ